MSRHLIKLKNELHLSDIALNIFISAFLLFACDIQMGFCGTVQSQGSRAVYILENKRLSAGPTVCSL